MADTLSNVTFAYTHCTREDFHAQANFSEEQIQSELAHCFETQLKIQHIHVEFIIHSADPVPQLTCSIRVESPELHNPEFHEEGFDFMQVIRAAVHEAIQYIRKEKDKLADHSSL